MILVTAFLFGATLGIAVGPIAVLIANTGLRHGAGAGLRAGLGAATADFIYAVVTFLIGARLAPLLAENRGALELGAALLLTGFGIWMLRGALAQTVMKPPAGNGHDAAGRPFLTTLSLTIVNPLTVLLFLGFTAHLPETPDMATVLGAATALFLGSMAMQTVFALGGAGLARVLKDAAWVRRVNIASAVGIILFGVTGLV